MNTFYNWSQEDITLKWDNKPYPVKAGEFITDFIKSAGGEGLVLTPGILKTFSRQLGDRECNRLNVKPSNSGRWESIRLRALQAPQKYSDRPEDAPKHDPHLAFMDTTAGTSPAVTSPIEPSAESSPAPEPMKKKAGRPKKTETVSTLETAGAVAEAVPAV